MHSRHFYYQREAILKQCQEWLKQAKDEAAVSRYTGLVQNHNCAIADKFASSPMAYHDAIAGIVKQIETALASLKPPEDIDDDDDDDEE